MENNILTTDRLLSRRLTIPYFSGPVAAEHIHLQHQIIQSDRCPVQACRPLDRQPKESSLQPGIKTRQPELREKSRSQI